LSRRRKKEKKSHYKIMHFSLLIYGHNNWCKYTWLSMYICLFVNLLFKS
jgi:hypothetical protein